MKLVSPLQRGTMCQCRWPGQPGAGGAPQVQPDIKSFASRNVSSRAGAEADRLQQFELLFGRQLVEPPLVPARADQQMPVVVGITIENDDNLAARDRPAGSPDRRRWPRRDIRSRRGRAPGRSSSGSAGAGFLAVSPCTYASRQGAQSCSFFKLDLPIPGLSIRQTVWPRPFSDHASLLVSLEQTAGYGKADESPRMGQARQVLAAASQWSRHRVTPPDDAQNRSFPRAVHGRSYCGWRRVRNLSLRSPRRLLCLFASI